MNERRLTAEMMPVGMPISSQRTVAPATRSPVVGSRWKISVVTCSFDW